MGKPDFNKCASGELLDYCGDNAARWAEAFCAIKKGQGWTSSDINEDLMLGWFANAIEHSSQVRRPQTIG